MKPNRSEIMGTESIWKLIFKFSGPAIISMTVASTYNLADAVFVGRISPEALAAMSVTYPLVLSFIAIAAGTGIGATSLISRYLGAGESRNADAAAGVALSLCFIVSAIIALVCLPNLDSLLRMLGADDNVLLFAADYMSTLIKFAVFSFLSLVLANIIRAGGNPLFSSIISISASLINIILDPVFIFGFGPVPAMGIQGAAIATVIAQATGTFIYLYYIISGRTEYRLRPSSFIPFPRIIVDIYRIGSASIARSGAQFLVMGIMNKTAASFGVTTLAIMGVLIRLSRFIQMPIIGLGQGILPLIGYNFGAGNSKRVKKLVFNAFLSSGIWSVISFILIMSFPGHVISMFSSGSAFMEEGVIAVRLFFLLTFIFGFQMVPGFFFQAIGKGFSSTLLSSARYILFLLPMLLILPRFYGVNGLWAAFPASDIMAFFLAVIWLAREFRKQEMI